MQEKNSGIGEKERIGSISAHEFGKDKEDKYAGEEQRDRGKGKDR